MSKNKWRHIPNILTILRILAVPLMAVWMVYGKWAASLILFIAAGFTDILDGYIARKYQFVTNFGKLADPFADKMIQLTALFLLAWDGRIPYCFFYFMAVKELAMIAGSLFFLRKEVVVSSNWIGKAASAILFTGIVLAFLNLSIAGYMMWVGVGVSFSASIVYLKGYLKQLKS